ncbi:MAG: trypsin-like serine protease [Oligoflexales bacterium]
MVKVTWQTILFVLAVLLNSCKSAHSGVKVTNGVGADETEFPFVTRTPFSGCTATVISPQVILTAAHCTIKVPDLEHTETGRFNTWNIKDATIDIPGRVFINPAVALFEYPTFTMENWGEANMPFDLAAYVFNPGEFREFAKVTDVHQRFKLQDKVPVTLVGYGNSETFDGQHGEGSGILRTGTNTLEFDTKYTDEILALPGAYQPDPDRPGEWSTAGAGDSGGPLFLTNTQTGGTPREIIGVVSGGSTGQGRFVDLGFIRSKLFFLYLARTKVDINIAIEEKYFDGVRNIPFGTYVDSKDSSCKMTVVDTRDRVEGRPGLVFIPTGCQRKDRITMYCDAGWTSCKTKEGAGKEQASGFAYTSFKLKGLTSDVQTFEFTPNKP